MSESYPVISSLSTVSNWPNREFPQERFDKDIVDSMNQMSEMVSQLNNDFIPTMNQILQKLKTDLNNVNVTSQEAKEEVSQIRNDINAQSSSFREIVNYVNGLGTRFDTVNSKFEQIESSFKVIEDQVTSFIFKNGQRGILAGKEIAEEREGSSIITADSSDAINITGKGGKIILTFQPAEEKIRAIKTLCLIAKYDTGLEIKGGTWSAESAPPDWGKANSFLILAAHFIGGRVFLNVVENRY